MPVTESGLQFECFQFKAAVPTHIQSLVDNGAFAFNVKGCGGVCNVALQVVIDELAGQEIGCVGPNDAQCPRAGTSEITLL